MIRLSNRTLWWRCGIALLVLLTLWAIGLGWWLPRWLKPQIEAQASRALHTPVTVQSLSLSPWTLTAEISALRVGTDAAPLLTIEQVQAQISLQTLWRMAPVLRRLTLTRPQLFVERVAAQRFNFSPIVDHLHAQPSAPGEESPRFALYNIQVIQGHIRYTDQVLADPEPQHHTISGIELGIPFLSNLPGHIAIDVQPRLDAVIDGSPLHIEGRTQPFDRDYHSELTLNWQRVDLAFWARALRPLLPPAWRLDLSEGQLDARLQLLFDQPAAPTVPTLRISGDIDVSGLDARWPQQGLSWRWQTLALQGLRTEPLARTLRLERVALKGVQADLHAPATAPAAAPPAVTTKPQTPTTAAPAWAWQIGAVDLAVEQLRWQPTGAAAAARPAAASRGSRTTVRSAPTLGPVTLRVQNLDSRPQAAPATLRLEWADSLQARGQISGTLQPHALSASLDLSVDAFQPAAWLAQLKPMGAASLQAGTLSLRTHLEASNSQIHLSRGELIGKNLRAQTHATPAAGEAADQFSATTVSLSDWQARLDFSGPAGPLTELDIGRVQAEQLAVSASRNAQGRWLWQGSGSALAAPRATPSPTAPPGAAPTNSLPAPRITIRELQCQDCAAQVNDHSTQPATRVAVSRTQARVAPLSSDLRQLSTFELQGQAQRNGRFALRGEVRAEPLAVRSSVQLKDIDLRGVQPLIDPYLQATVNAARLQAQGQVAVQSEADGRLGARYTGRLALSDLRASDRVTDDDFLRWKIFSLDELDVAWQGGALRADLGRMALRDFDARLILNANGQLNLSQLLRQKGAAEQSITTPTASPLPAASAAGSSSSPAVAMPAASAVDAPPSGTPPWSLRWAGFEFSGGRINFTDTFIKPNYSARLTQIKGSVAALSSQLSEPAQLQLEGRVDDAAPLLVGGVIHPLGARLHTDLTAKAQGIELTRLSTYAARYAGYPITKGSLSVTLNYKINAGQLEASNRIMLDQLTFGERVDSPDATKLPVLFAVSLLKNHRGEIDVNLPISGSIDDPQFSVGGIVVKIFVNLLTRAVSAPFSLLTGGAEGHSELGFVPFEPGSARLGEAAQQRLDTLAKALAERPALKLEIVGHAHRGTDVKGLQSRHVQRLIRTAKAKATDSDANDTTVSDDERPRWLSAAYQAAKIDKPRNALGLPKTLPAADMERLLAASAPVDDEALLRLANRRSDAVKAYLAGKLEVHRILMGAALVDAPAPAGPAPLTRVQFTLQ